MAKGKRVDTSALFQDMIPREEVEEKTQKESEEKIEVKPPQKSDVTKPGKEVQQEQEQKQEPDTKVKRKGRRPTEQLNEAVVQKAYYITEKQYQALKIKAAYDNSKDMSAVVRDALNLYLADILSNL